MDRSKILTMLSLLKSSGIPVPVCCQWVKKIDKSKILTWPSPFRSPVMGAVVILTVLDKWLLFSLDSVMRLTSSTKESRV